MNEQRIARYEQLLGHKLTTEEVERLRRISGVLRISDNDALWDIIIAMEYQRTFYEALPQRIEQSSANIFEHLSNAAQQEVTKAQASLAECVVAQAKRLSLREHGITYLIWGSIVFALTIIYGSLMLWVGLNMGSQGVEKLHAILRMPSGIILMGLALCGSLFTGMCAARYFSEDKSIWRRYALIATACCIIGALTLAITLKSSFM